VKPATFLRELALPVTDKSLLFALVVFSLLILLAFAASVLGLWLLVLVVPALYKYLLLVLDARAIGGRTPVAAIELFNFADILWGLTPLVFQAASAVAVWQLRAHGYAYLARAVTGRRPAACARTPRSDRARASSPPRWSSCGVGTVSTWHGRSRDREGQDARRDAWRDQRLL
jgi:hypothetical protein